MRSGDEKPGSPIRSPLTLIQEPPPEFLPVTGGTALITRMSRVLLSGESGEGSTWAALTLAVEHMRATEPVVWLDANGDGPDLIVERLRLLGAVDEDIAYGFGYAQMYDAGDLPALAEAIRRRRPSLLVVDGWGMALAAVGMRCDDEDDLARWCRVIADPVWKSGGVVLTTCDPETAEGWARRGVDLHLRIAQVGAPRFSRERDGLFRLDVGKDRLGHVRPQADAFLLSLSHREGGIRWNVRPEEVAHA